MLKCGIIGFGKMGQIRAKALENSGQAIITAVYDIADMSDCAYPVVENEEAVINADVDAVFVCTPNFKIKPLVEYALKKGKYVFAEKPPGINLEEALSMQQTEKETGKILMFGFNHRHHSSIKRMKEIVESGEMGKILWMRGRYGKEVDEAFFNGWRANKELSGGGIMLDQGIHMLDLFLHLGGGFDEVKAFVSNLYWKIEGIEDNVFAIFRNNETGMCASLHSTMTQWRYLFSLEVFLEEGALILNGLKTSSGAYGDEDLVIKKNSKHIHEGKFDTEEHVVFHVDKSWDSEIEHFLACIKNNTQPSYGSTNDAVALMQLMDKIYKN
jgi:1,5-anhydro-D-fructose reductase (1,5-anhydro-D-mannitol-forming)